MPEGRGCRPGRRTRCRHGAERDAEGVDLAQQRGVVEHAYGRRRRLRRCGCRPGGGLEDVPQGRAGGAAARRGRPTRRSRVPVTDRGPGGAGPRSGRGLGAGRALRGVVRRVGRGSSGRRAGAGTTGTCGTRVVAGSAAGCGRLPGRQRPGNDRHPFGESRGGWNQDRSRVRPVRGGAGGRRPGLRPRLVHRRDAAGRRPGRGTSHPRAPGRSDAGGRPGRGPDRHSGSDAAAPVERAGTTGRREVAPAGPGRHGPRRRTPESSRGSARGRRTGTTATRRVDTSVRPPSGAAHSTRSCRGVRVRPFVRAATPVVRASSPMRSPSPTAGPVVATRPHSPCAPTIGRHLTLACQRYTRPRFTNRRQSLGRTRRM